VIFGRPKPSPPAQPERAPRLAEGDERAALERTLRALLPEVRRWLFRMLGPSPALDDATQDVLLALASALPQLADASKRSAFARTITTRVAYKYFARKDACARLAPEQHAHGAKLPDAQLAEQRALVRLHRCMAKLPPKRRVAFVLCAVEGLSYAEAAAIAGTSEGSMRARHMHARKELMRLLGPEAAEEADV
jgi:RNA polymerase sigma-70 factor, ECF subfamily